MGPAYNEFGYNEQPLTSSLFSYTVLIDNNVKMFGYNELSPTTKFLLHRSTRCKRDPVYVCCKDRFVSNSWTFQKLNVTELLLVSLSAYGFSVSHTLNYIVFQRY